MKKLAPFLAILFLLIAPTAWAIETQQDEGKNVTDPFDEGVLWIAEHDVSIARDVAISGDGGYIMTGWEVNDLRASLYEVQGSGIPLWEYVLPTSMSTRIRSAFSDDNNVIASIGVGLPLTVWLNGSGPDPTWQCPPPNGYKGYYCDVSDDGQYVVSVYRQYPGQNGKLKVFTTNSPTVLWEIDYEAPFNPNGVEISDDNNWILVITYQHIYIFNNTSQSLFWAGTNYGETMGGISGDGEFICSCDWYGRVHVYQRAVDSYNEIWSDYVGGWMQACDISADASTVIAGNYHYYGSEVCGYDISGNQIFSYDQYGDKVSDVALCDDGSIGIAGSWGALNCTYGDVFTAFDMSDGSVIFQLLDDIDEPGSIMDVAISHDGMYAVCGGRAVHCQSWGNGGIVYSIQLGSPSPLTVDLTYVSGSPVPAGGGIINYVLFCGNVGSTSLNFDGWLDIAYEGGAPTTVAQRYFENFQPGETIDFPDIYFPVPSTYAAGNYEFFARTGFHPDLIWVEDSFPFVKSGTDVVPGFIPWVPDNMPNPFESFDTAAFPGETILLGAYPNPFNPTTVLSYELRNASVVNLAVYDIAGSKVADLADGWRDAGVHEVTFDAGGLASGIYFYRLTAGEFSGQGKMVLMK